jgi:hypothetical protein
MHLRILLATAVFMTLCLAGCQATPSANTQAGSQKTRPVTAAEAAENRERPFKEAQIALEEYRCGTGSTEAVLAKISELEKHARIFTAIGSYSYADTAREHHTTVAFAFAEEAIKKGDLDAADQVYRRLIEFYVGSAYAGIRDRARLGIDDIREARRGTK